MSTPFQPSLEQPCGALVLGLTGWRCRTLSVPHSNGTWDEHGACDGTLSFPDLGMPPFDGSAPVIAYAPDCGRPDPLVIAFPVE